MTNDLAMLDRVLQHPGEQPPGHKRFLRALRRATIAHVI
jgi:hypothetical protein